MCGAAKIDLRDFEKLRVVAIGKAAHAMVDGLALVLAPFVRLEGVVSAPTAPRKPVAGMKYFVAGHPVPNVESWKAAEAILALLRKCNEKTLVFFLLSGGGSALVELPLDPAQTLENVQQVHRALVTCGAPIAAINAVRKHLSGVKGGRLAVAANHATKITLAVSDVPMGKESALASGPTIPDRGRRSPIQVLSPTQNTLLASTCFTKSFHQLCRTGSTKEKCRRLQKPMLRHFETHTSYCRWGWMICFIRRITRPKEKDS